MKSANVRWETFNLIEDALKILEKTCDGKDFTEMRTRVRSLLKGLKNLWSVAPQPAYTSYYRILREIQKDIILTEQEYRVNLLLGKNTDNIIKPKKVIKNFTQLKKTFDKLYNHFTTVVRDYYKEVSIKNKKTMQKKLQRRKFLDSI